MINKQTNSNHNVITESINLLLVLALFYNFAKWPSYGQLSAKIFGIFACAYVLNNWLSTRSTFNIYSLSIFYNDIVGIFLIVYLPFSLSVNDEIWGYSPTFWLAIGLIEFLNVFWNLHLHRKSNVDEAKRFLTGWVWMSFIAGLLSLILFLYLSLGENILLGHAVAGILTAIFIVMTVAWNVKRYNFLKNTGTSFFD